MSAISMLGITYVVLVLFYAICQQLVVNAARRRQEPPRLRRGRPTIDVLVPCYNENPALLSACCESLRRAGDAYGDDKIRYWLVDDGSANRDALEEVYRRWESRRQWRVVRLDGHRGKREAQDAVFGAGRGRLVVMIDSDTTIHPGSLMRLAARFAEAGVGAASGNVRVANAHQTLLTGLIRSRYRLLFDHE